MAALQLNLFPWHFVRQLERNEKMKVHLGHQKKVVVDTVSMKTTFSCQVVYLISFTPKLHTHLVQDLFALVNFCSWILPSGDPWGLLSRWRSGCEGCPTLQNGRGHHVNPKGVLGKRSLTIYESWWCVLTPELSRMIIYMIYLECQQLRS